MNKHKLVIMGDSATCTLCDVTADRQDDVTWAKECTGIKPKQLPIDVPEIKARSTGLKMSDNVDPAGGIDGSVGDTGITGPGSDSPTPDVSSTPPAWASNLPEMSVAEAFAARDAYRRAHPEIADAWAKSRPTANTILQDAQQHLLDRAAQRDQEQERSMERTVRAYNAITGHNLSERDGWMFMVMLKAARACTTPAGIADDYEDLVAYGSLAGEAAAKP